MPKASGSPPPTIPLPPISPIVEVEQVHRAAAAARAAGRLAQHLRRHPLQVEPLGDGVAVSAMGAELVVVLAQAGADAGGDGLLPFARMQCADRLAGLGPLAKDRLHPQLERADGVHHPQQLKRFFFRYVDHGGPFNMGSGSGRTAGRFRPWPGSSPA